MANDKNVAITLTVNGQQFQAQMRQSGQSVRDFGSSARPAAAELQQLTSIMKGVAGASAAIIAAGAGIAALVNDQANAIADYQDLAEKIGDTAVAVASLQRAADVSGTSLDTVAAAAVKLTAGLAKTDDETKGAGLAIKQLGLDFDAFKQLTPVEQIDAIAKAFQGFADDAGRTAIAVQLFGKSGADLIPFFNDLADGSERQTALTAQQIEAADAYTKQVARLKSEFSAVLQQASAQVIPVFGNVLKVFREVSGETDDLGDAADDLSRGTALRDFAQTSAIALATLYESLVFVGKAARTVAGSFEAVFADLAVAGEFVGRGGVVGLAFESNRTALAATLEKRNQTVEAANARLKDLIDYDGAQLSNALRKQFAESNAAALLPPSAAERDQRPSLGVGTRPTASGGSGSNSTAVNTELRQQEQAIRRQQEKNLLLETEQRLGRDITAAQAELLLLNRELAPISSTSLQAELEKTVALEDQLAKTKELARLKDADSRRVASEADRFLRDTAPRSEGRDGIQSIRDEGENGTRAELDRVYANTRENELQALESQLQELAALRAAALEAGLERDSEFAEREVSLRAQTNERLAQADRAYQATKDVLREQELQRASDFFGNLATVAQAFGDKGFKAFKAFATAQAIISTYESATKAYSSLAAVPIIGPALGAAAAAAAVAAGLAQVRAIQSQQPTGREFGGPVGPNGLVQVGERDKPELLRSGGKTYLVPGDQGGSVSPAQQASAGSSGAPVINIYRAPAGVESVNTRRNAQGGMEIDILFEQLDQRMAAGYARGTSALSKQIANTSGISRVPGAI